MWKRVQSKFPLIIVILVALFFRLYPGLHAIIFPYDQARDVLIFQDMVARRHPVLIGPTTDIPGVHHGPLFYDLFAPIYAISGWDPWLPLLVLVGLNLFSLLPLYMLMNEMKLPKATKILGMSFFVVSFELISYARWLSNPSLAVPLMGFLLLFLWRVWNGKKISATLLGILLGLLVQVEVVLVYLLLPCYLALIKRRASLRQWMLFHLGALIGAAPLVVAELKFKFQATKAVIGYLLQKDPSHPPVPFAWVGIGISSIGRLVANNVFAIPTLVASFLFLCLVISLLYLTRAKKHFLHTQTQFLLLILCFSCILFFIGKRPEIFFFVGIGFALILLTSFFLTLMLQSRLKIFAACLSVVMIGSQVVLFFQETSQKHAYIQVQKGVMLDQRMEVMKAIYDHVPAQTPFTISVFETPYGVRSAWSYYFWFYANKYHLAIPQWYGFAANGFIGDEILPRVDAPAALHITVYEPEFSIPQQYLDAFMTEQNAHTTVLETFTVNYHRIEVRKPKEK